MENIYELDEDRKKKLQLFYRFSGIDTRYSVLHGAEHESKEASFYPALGNQTSFPDLETRMELYNKNAAPLSISAINNCMNGYVDKKDITHLITVSCTGMSAPGLDLEIMEAMELPLHTVRTSVNFMGCYAAVHALKLADAFCQKDEMANVIIVCTELCTLHLQQKPTMDNFAAGLLFADGCAAVLVTNNSSKLEGFTIKNFYSEVSFKGKKDMGWELSSTGFLMTLSSYIPKLIEEDFSALLNNALQSNGVKKDEITAWCMHPGGKKILSAIAESINLPDESLKYSYDVLRNYGNMSSPSILFVLKLIIDDIRLTGKKNNKIFGAAFGPGITMETFLLSDD